MSEQVAISKLQDWLRKSLSSELSQAEREREKNLGELARVLDSLPQTCSQLSRKAEQDMETKRENRAEYRAAKAVVRLTGIITGMCQSITIGSSKDTASLRNLQREISKFATEAARARQEWLRQIRPYYIIDMMTLGGNIDKVRRLGEELHNFLMGRGSLLRSLEELDEKLDSVSKLRATKDLTASQRHSLEEKIAEAKDEEDKLRKEVEDIRNRPKMKEYLQIDSGLRELRTELLKTGFSRLGRPLKKLISISERGNYPLQIDVRESATEYAKKPFTTFLNENEGYPRLKTVMSALSKAVSSGKLALKQREAKKVIERSDQVVSGESLASIHAKAKALKQSYDSLLADQEISELVERLKETRQKGRANRGLQEELKADLGRTINGENRLEDQLNVLLRDIEAFIRKFSGTTPRIQLA
jgi:hypothetical protein